ncbi:MAG: VWA domain-containing protein [Clostridia bacterium]|nr:VWA domain-containing protein [Clostridia bacterium]
MGQFIKDEGGLKLLSDFLYQLKPEAKKLAIKYASKLIIKMAGQIADTGYRRGVLTTCTGMIEDGELDVELTIGNILENPTASILDNLVFQIRQQEKRSFVMMLDHSFSMKGFKIVLAAITTAAIALHFKRNYAVLAFSSKGKVIKATDQEVSPELILEKIFALELMGDTNIRDVLSQGLKQMNDHSRKIGLLLTDGHWNQGGNPLEVAGRYDKLSVICFPPAKPESIKALARQGKGKFFFVSDEMEIPKAIIHCLG